MIQYFDESLATSIDLLRRFPIQRRHTTQKPQSRFISHVRCNKTFVSTSLLDKKAEEIKDLSRLPKPSEIVGPRKLMLAQSQDCLI